MISPQHRARMQERSVLWRERLIERLRHECDNRMSVVIAPAGCGKSTLLRHYRSDLTTPSCLFDVRPHDAGLAGVVRGFAAALAEHAPHAAIGVAEVLRTHAHDKHAAQKLAVWFSQIIPAHVATIIIDDFHIAQDTVCVAFVDALIGALTTARFVVASRSQSNLPLRRWITAGWLNAPLLDEDLRFTLPEAKAAALLLDNAPAAEDVEALFRFSSGWATSLHLSLRLREHLPSERAMITAKQLAYAFLAENMYETLAPTERELLEVGAVVGRLDVDALTEAGFDNAAECLAAVAERTGILASYGPSGGTPEGYTVRDLFADFLQNRAHTQPAGVEETLLRLGRAYLHLERFPQALDLFVRSQAHEDILATLRFAPEMIGAAYDDVVQAAITALSATPFAQGAAALYAHATLVTHAGDVITARRLYEAAVAAPTDNRDLRARILLGKAAADFTSDQSLCPQLEELARDRSVGLGMRASISCFLLMVRARDGTLFNHPQLHETAETMANAVSAPQVRARCLHRLAIAAFYIGDHARVLRSIEAPIALQQSLGMWPLLARLHSLAGLSWLLNGDNPIASLAEMRRAAAIARTVSMDAIRGEAILSQLDPLFFVADLEAIEAVEREAGSLWSSQSRGDGTRSRITGLCLLLRKDFDRAAAIFSQSAGESEYVEYNMLCDALSVFCGALGSKPVLPTGEVAKLTQRVDVSVRQEPVARFADFATAIVCLTFALTGDRDSAMRLLAGPPHSKSRCASAFQRLALAVCSGALTDNDDTQALTACGYGLFVELAAIARHHLQIGAVALSGVEQLIWRRLDEGAAPKEIAAELGLSVNTIRWHIQRTIKRLGCSGRAAALAALRELELLN